VHGDDTRFHINVTLRHSIPLTACLHIQSSLVIFTLAVGVTVRHNYCLEQPATLAHHCHSHPTRIFA
jgi:hypothetical protein